MTIFQHRIPLSGGPRDARESGFDAQDSASEHSARSSRIRRLLTQVAHSAVVTTLTGPAARQVVVRHAATVGILGGIVCTPVISVAAWVGMVLPAQAALHQIAPALMTTALVWLALAIILAHACRPHQDPQPLEHPSKQII